MKNKKFIKYTKYAVSDSLKSAPYNFLADMLLFVTDPVVTILSPLIMVEIINAVTGDQGVDLAALRRGILFLCVIKIVPQVTSLLSNSAMASDVMGKSEIYFGKRMLEHSGRLKLEALEKEGVLDVFQRAGKAYSEMFAVTEFFAGINTLVRSIVNCIGSIIVVTTFSFWLLPGALIGSIPHLILAFIKEKEYAKLRGRQTAVQRKLKYLWDLFINKEAVKEMRTANFDGYLCDKWTKENEQVVLERQQFEEKVMNKINLFDCVQNAFYALNIGISVVLLIKREISIAQFSACLGAFAVLQSRLSGVISLISITAREYKFVEEYYDFFDLGTEKDGDKEYKPFQEKIAFKDVHFSYPSADKKALDGVNCEIKKGEHVVIVGENGSGKTTLSKVLTGAYTAESGEVTYDGVKVQDFTRKSLCRNISIVPQDFVHYNFTLRENIGISDVKYAGDDRRMESTIDRAELKSLVEAVGGVDVQLGREFDGRELSGGEWQRVAIARGLFKDCGLIILDEPTSALDPLIEYEVLTRFLKLIRGKTSVIISHRVGICRMADKIIVMKNGRAVESGTHETLLSAGGEYKRIWNEQAKWYI